MIYVTGDIHGGIDMKKLNSKSLRNQNIQFAENDYLIICGDFGLPFLPTDIEQYKKQKGSYYFWINWLKKFPCKILFIDGNHDNHDWWSEQAITEMFGGKVQIHPHADNVIHLMRGQVYTIENKKFFTLGGAMSTDKAYRIEGISWWKNEMPSKEEYELAIKNLDDNNMTVDYVITHNCGSSYLNDLFTMHMETDELTSFLNHLEFDFGLKFKHWYFGHHHIDKQIDDKHTCIYNKILAIK